VFELGDDLTLISCMKKRCCDKETSQWPIFSFGLKYSRPIYNISITSGFYLTVSFTSEDKYAMTKG
jgi:hypothetical protein